MRYQIRSYRKNDGTSGFELFDSEEQEAVARDDYYQELKKLQKEMNKKEVEAA